MNPDWKNTGLNALEVDALKGSIPGSPALAYIEELEGQNQRLHSHHSDCKTEFGRVVEMAQRWRIQAYVCEKLARFLNRNAPWWRPEDFGKEICIQTDRLIGKWKNRENWMIEEEARWDAMEAK